MTFKRISQDSDAQKKHILEILMLLIDSHGLKQIEIARQLGYTKDVFSQIKTGFSSGSPQLLAGLCLLKEVIELRKQAISNPRDFVKELEVIKGRVEEMQRSLTKYPKHTPQNWQLNEPVDPASLSPADKAAWEAAKLAVEAVKKGLP